VPQLSTNHVPWDKLFRVLPGLLLLEAGEGLDSENDDLPLEFSLSEEREVALTPCVSLTNELLASARGKCGPTVSGSSFTFHIFRQDTRHVDGTP
jgi:hypothetical protein